jgi:hypothetical protein
VKVATAAAWWNGYHGQVVEHCVAAAEEVDANFLFSFWRKNTQTLICIHMHLSHFMKKPTLGALRCVLRFAGMTRSEFCRCHASETNPQFAGGLNGEMYVLPPRKPDRPILYKIEFF